MALLLKHDHYYHIYNRGNNYENIFTEEKDYLYFLKTLEIYIIPVADIYAWCLMKNHFHLLVRIKEEREIGYLNAANAKSENPELKWKTYLLDESNQDFNRKPKPIQQFKHIFNAYASWFNIVHKRRGSLFEFDYKRKLVDNLKQLLNLILYIHRNPVTHGFVDHISEYPWISYHSIISEESSLVKKEVVLNYFEGVENFKYVHKSLVFSKRPDLEDLETK